MGCYVLVCADLWVWQGRAVFLQVQPGYLPLGAESPGCLIKKWILRLPQTLWIRNTGGWSPVLLVLNKLSELFSCTHFKFQMYSCVVQLASPVGLFATPWTGARQAFLSLTTSQFVQVHVHWICDAIQPSHLCCPRLLLSSVFPSIRVFSGCKINM